MDRWHALATQMGGSEAAIVIAAVAVLALVTIALLWGFRRRGRRASSDALAEAGRPLPEKIPPSLHQGLAKTRAGFLQRILPLLGRDRLDPETAESLEAALLAADVGIRMTERLMRGLEGGHTGDAPTVQARLERGVLEILTTPPASGRGSKAEVQPPVRPWVILIVGVNGVGKTTTIAKLAARYSRSGRRVLLVAGDTFRAAAIEQLEVWAGRIGADLVRHQHGGDPGAVVHDGLRAALARGSDVVIIDTAGRLHTKSNLMDELRKVCRVIAREIPGAPHETLLVIDAVTGQNGLTQGRAFLEQVPVTGVVLTKLDGTAKGGIVVAIAGELGIPVRYVGVGEGIDDLREFDARQFASALLGIAEPQGFP